MLINYVLFSVSMSHKILGIYLLMLTNSLSFRVCPMQYLEWDK